ncbi:MAG TPA: FUSC family protein [Solirubrobacteraceae bacterium]
MTTTSAPAATREAPRTDVRTGAVHSLALAAACYVSYWLTTDILSQLHSLSATDDKLGGLWAVVATVFVYRTSYQQNAAAAVSRTAATAFSCVLCLIYLLILPVSAVGLAVLIGIGTLILTLIRRSADIVTAGITTAVVLVVAGLARHDAWQEPILRAADTAIGIAVGLAASLVVARLRTLHRS